MSWKCPECGNHNPEHEHTCMQCAEDRPELEEDGFDRDELGDDPEDDDDAATEL